MGVNVFGFIGGEFGLGEAVRLIIKALNKAEIPVSLINYDIETNHRHEDATFQDFSSDAIHPINLVLLGPSEAKNVITHYPDNGFFKDKYNIFYLNWESEYISPEFIENLNFYDEIWVPAQYVKDTMANFSDIPVSVIPYPIDIKINNEKDPEVEDFYPNNSFNFLFMFDYNSSLERKNTLNLISAFEKAFGKEDESVSLIIKTSKSTKFQEEKKSLEARAAGFKNIKIVEKIFEKQTLHKIIKNCDAYISLHRSEGFGLTMAEAMYFGNPVIATNYSGNLQFMNAENSFLVDYTMSAINATNTNYDSNTVWSDPNIEHAAKLMKLVKENGESVQKTALKGQETIQTDLSEDRIGVLLKDRIGVIMEVFQPSKHKNQLIDLIIENDAIKRELQKIKSSKMISKILDIKLYFRNRKKRK